MRANRVVWLGWVALLWGGCGERVYTEEFLFDGTVDRVETDLGPATATLTTSDALGARINVELRYSGSRPEFGVVLEQTTLYLTLLCDDPEACDGSFSVFVPPAVSANLNSTTGGVVVEGIGGVVTVTTDEGPVDLDEIGGSVDLRNASGPTNLRGVTGSLTADSHDGEIVVDQVGGDLELSSELGLLVGTHLASAQGSAATNSGPVYLTWDESPSLVEIETVSGDIVLTVPAGPYQVVAGSTVGEVTVDGVSEEPGATNVLRVTSEFGNITISGV
jgi:hypothetical protein